MLDLLKTLFIWEMGETDGELIGLVVASAPNEASGPEPCAEENVEDDDGGYCVQTN